MVKKPETEKHITAYLRENWNCLIIYCQFEKTNPTRIMNELLNKFLIENKEKMKIYMKRQQDIIEGRNENL